MDRLTKLRGEAGSSGDSTLDTSTAPSEAYLTANESSKYFSLSEDESTFDITPIKDVSLASTVEPDKTITVNDQLISDLSPISKKNDLLGYKFDKQIEAANILSGGVDIFDDNDNSYDGDGLVIDDNAEIDDKSNPEVKNAELQLKKPEEIVESLDSEPTVGNKELDVDGKKVNAIDIGNGLYLYRKPGEEELAAVQIVADDNDQPSCKYLKVRENAEGNLEVYEEIEIEVPKEVPTREEKFEKNSHVPINDINPVSNKVAETKPTASTSEADNHNKVLIAEGNSEINLNGKMKKYNETRKSPVIHSTPNKEGIPLTKTMVDMHLHPSRPAVDKAKTVEVHTDNKKLKINENQTKNIDCPDDQTSGLIACIKEIEKLAEVPQTVSDSKKSNEVTNDSTVFIKEQEEGKTPEKTEIQTAKCSDNKETEEVNLVTTENKEKKMNKDYKPATSVECEKQSEEKYNNDFKMPGKPNLPEKDKESDEIVKQKDSKETKKDDFEEIQYNYADGIKKGKSNLTEVKDSACETDSLSLITKDNLQTNVNIQKREQKCERSKDEKIIESEKNKDEKIITQMKCNSCNEIKSSITSEKDGKIIKDISMKVQDISNKSNKNNLNEIEKPEHTLPQILDEKVLTENRSEKNKKHVTEFDLPKHDKSSTENVETISAKKIEPEIKGETSLENKKKVYLSTVPDNRVFVAQNKIMHSEVTSKETIVICTKQCELTTPIEHKALMSKDVSQPDTNQLDQEKLVPPVVQTNTHVVETKQFSASTPVEIGVSNKSVPDKPNKEDSKQQEQTKTMSNEDNIQLNQNQNKTEIKANRLPPTVPMGPQRKLELTKLPRSITEKKPVINSTTEKKPVISCTTDKKPILNNIAAVPFGQWTPANRQEFLNKIKEAKIQIPVTVSNTKPISKPNDLNRRDVLQKIDSQRQSSNAATKNQDLAKIYVKNEAPTFKNKPVAIQPSSMIRESKDPVKVELPATNKPVVLKKDEKPETAQTTHRSQANSTVTSTYMAKSEGTNRNEFNNQHLIDKTVEGIINRAVATKPQDPKPYVSKEPTKIQTSFSASYKSKETKPSILDAIEMKMNELHGIPFVERPPHELPKVYNHDIKTYAKGDTKSTNRVSKIPNLMPVSQIQKKDHKNDIIDLDSEEEVIEHEPITGDIDLSKRMFTSKQSNTSAETTMAQIGSDSSKKESIITEKDFDKFVRRNSITYENCLTVNLETNKNRNVVQGLVQKDIIGKNVKKVLETNKSPPKQKTLFHNNPQHKINITTKLVPVNEDSLNANYQSKLQLAYQTALTTKRQMESPITIIEDKPVKVVFMDSNTNFQASQLNVQGPNLSPSKNSVMPKEPDLIAISTGNSLDSEVMETVDFKAQDDTKSNKTKHQRKQVLTPVEAPELELIVPGDLGIEASPKKKRKMEDFKVDKSPKSLVPKKSYLLGHNTESPSSLDSPKDVPNHLDERNTTVNHKDTASAIDNLVKAAELIENQAGNFKHDDSTSENTSSSATPVKRGRGRPRKYPLPDGTPNNPKAPSPQKKPRLIDNKEKVRVSQSASDEDTSDDSIGEGIVRENWTMGKINENIVCPICNKLFRSENVVFKHVKHCPGPSPNRSDSDKRSSRRSRLSNDSKSMDSKLDDTEGETDSIISKKSSSVILKKTTPKKRKSKENTFESNEEVIVIEDTPVKSKVEKNNEPKLHESRKPTKTKAQYKVSTLSCEFCGKTFRQLSYLVSHKLLHKKANPKSPKNVTQVGDKSVFSCEVCNKEFRKLHHLVQHRIIHNSNNVPKLSRKSSSEQNVDNKTSKDKESKPEDQSAAFRCEPCDKSFRKLHHLVEHRETHDGINRQKGGPTAQTTEKIIQNPPPPPQCDVCKKTFRKLHHLIEHKEQHIETSSEKSDDKSVKSALSTKDIIHECSLCYMVFPNEHSLNKHSVFCQKKKKQSIKPQKQTDEAATAEQTEIVVGNDERDLPVESAVPKPKEMVDKTEPEDKTAVIEETIDVEKVMAPEIKHLENNSIELPEVIPNKRDLERASSPLVKATEAPEEAQEKLLRKEEKVVVEPKTPTEKTKKSPAKGLSAAKRRKSNLPLARIKETAAVESSDDDEVRYMLNPDYKEYSQNPDVSEATSEGKLFMKVRAKKRNSLQFERTNSKDLGKRRTSLQHPPKIPRLKPKVPEPNDSRSTVLKPAKLEPVPCTDSDDSDVKYSFPVKLEKPLEAEKTPKNKRKSVSEDKRKSVSENTPKAAVNEKVPKEKRKSLAEKRKTLSGIARRKSLGKPVSVKHKETSSPFKEMKRRRGEVEHRCDCGQLFSSGALLARHTSLAHTPPRVRRRRVDSQPPAPAPAPPASATVAPSVRKPSIKPTDSRKSSARSEPDPPAPPKAKPGRPPKNKTPVRKSIKPEPSGLQSRKSVAHRGVPVPEKMKTIMDKLK